MKININEIKKALDDMIPNPKCELDYNKDYELVIAVMLSAQCTDKRVNIVTKDLFKYSLNELANMDNKSLEKIIYSLGNYTKKAEYIKEISKRIIANNMVVPNDASFLESLPGVGHKTTNVILSELYGVPNFAVDTHVLRVSKRLKLTTKNDDVIKTEKKLMKYFNKEEYNKVNHQLLLLGRYTCLAKNPKCELCQIAACPNRQNKNTTK